MNMNWPGTKLDLLTKIDKIFDDAIQGRGCTSLYTEDAEEDFDIPEEDDEEEAKEEPSTDATEEYDGYDPITWTVHDPKTGKITHHKKS